ncbi:FadR/GntR family transcriptional regulator [Amycolatopsis endophytica]|uniref:DNA-binding FadR family transcriptional regulator n=1 Tax=Amycolatopsis endophytica TaxID=860233 RepID=A0A853B5W4_9PSEU|nr:FadR/GntR family transcriptional regulator [Amycolatopsis endophytica]NYI90205.1 DNA-binding FadR family transcriptional regulator [Amycolatopsis endophytica]
MRTPRGQELADSIVELIERRGLEPGDPLPPEPRLVEEFDVARNSLREALRTLQALGIVEIRHGYGTFVGAASMTALSPSLLFRTRARSREDLRGLRDLLEVRQILETELTCKLARQRDDALLDRLADCVRRMADPAVSAAADGEFHELLCTAAGNELAAELIRLFWAVYRQTEVLIGAPRTPADALVAKHQLIVDALAAGDPAVIADAVRRHFDEVRGRLEPDG